MLLKKRTVGGDRKSEMTVKEETRKIFKPVSRRNRVTGRGLKDLSNVTQNSVNASIEETKNEPTKSSEAAFE